MLKQLMNKETVNFWLLLFMTLIVIFLLKNYQVTQIKNFYLFEFSQVEKIKGFLYGLEKNDNRDGGRSYTCKVKYEIRGNTYALEESSIFPISGASLNDSILIKVVPQNPHVATIKTTSGIVIGVIITMMATILEIGLLIRLIKNLKHFFLNRSAFRK